MKAKYLRKISMLAALLLLGLWASSCAAQKTVSDHSAAGQAPSSEVQENGAAPEQEYVGKSVAVNQEGAPQKLIYTGTVEIRSEQFEEDCRLLKEQVLALGGYLSGELVSGTAPVAYKDAGRYAEITARIPTEKFQPYLDYAEGQMNVVHKQISVEDVTQFYCDNEARIELLEARYAKLKEHLAAAADMEDIIALEKEMSEILSELDVLKGKRRHLDNQVSYSTLTICLDEVVRSSGVATSRQGVGGRMGEAFTGTLRAIGVFFENTAVFLVGALPVLLILGGLAVILTVFIRVAKKRKAKGAKKRPEGPSSN